MGSSLVMFFGSELCFSVHPFGSNVCRGMTFVGSFVTQIQEQKRSVANTTVVIQRSKCKVLC